MMIAIHDRARRCLASRRGVTAAETGLLAAGIVVMVMLAGAALAGALTPIFSRIIGGVG